MEKTMEKVREELMRQEEEHKARIPQLTEFWINEGHQILSEDKWADWDRCVPIRLGDLYQGMELGMCLDIVGVLKEGDFVKAKKVMNAQNHSGMSWGLMKSMVRTFSDVGEEFVATLDC